MSNHFDEKNNGYIERVRGYTLRFPEPPLVYIETYGCQQNEADSECLAGMASRMGYEQTQDKSRASLILVNTCAVREHAELKALSHTGQLKHSKEKNPDLLIGVCGCMVQQEHRKEDIRHKYPYVDFVFGTNLLSDFPKVLAEVLDQKKRLFFVEPYSENDGAHCEGMPIVRQSAFRAWISIMYGCDNYCSYCIVPYVRGRERSRDSGSILAEAEELVGQGCREITLLGQNVNSYGKDLGGKPDFPALLDRLSDIKGDFLIRFMTSNPKDATRELIDLMAKKERIAKHLHLPLQSGSDAILQKMNRKYTKESFAALCRYAKEKMPGMSLTTDLIVGFPTETEEDFRATLAVMQEVRFDQIFSFIYSKRSGTRAAQMDGQVPPEVKKERMGRLLALQQTIAGQINASLNRTVQRVLIEGESKTNPDILSARSGTGKLIHIPKKIGKTIRAGEFARARIVKADAYTIWGELI